MEKVMDNTYVIYCYTSPSGKQYIGQSKNIASRKRQHRYAGSGCFAIKSALKKYGEENFTFAILKNNLTLDDANNWEMELIKTHNSQYPNGYNLSEGGGNPRYCEERSKKIQKTRRANPEKTAMGYVKAWETRRNTPGLIEAQIEKLKETKKNNPERVKDGYKKVVEFRKNNPDKVAEASKKMIATRKSDPEKHALSIQKMIETKRNNKEKLAQAIAKRKATWAENPEIFKQARMKGVVTRYANKEKEKETRLKIKKTWEGKDQETLQAIYKKRWETRRANNLQKTQLQNDLFGAT